jgi:hypothetical protein
MKTELSGIFLPVCLLILQFLLLNGCTDLQVKDKPNDLEVVSDEEFFNAVDLDFAGLEKVKSAVNNRDFPKAKEELLAYYKNRQNPKIVDDKLPSPENKPEAKDEKGERVCAGYIKAIGDREAFAGDKIDWYNFPASDPENRMQTVLVMTMNWHFSTEEAAKAYLKTGNYKYARKCIDLIKSWISQTKPFPKTPPIGKTGQVWRTIHYVEPRITRFMQCFFWLIDCPAVTIDEKITLLKAILPQIDYMKNNEVPNMPNMLVVQMQNLLRYAVWFPEFRESKEWTNTGVTKLNRLLDDFFYPDHAYIELCYFDIIKDWLATLNLMKQNNIKIPDGFEKKLELAFEFPMYMSKPNFKYPTINDVYEVKDPEPFPPTPDCWDPLLKIAAETFGRDDMRYVASYGREGKPPKYNSYYFPYGGFYIMRTDWTPQARYLVFDGGKNAGGHNHADKLTVEVYAYGNTLVSDTGCGGDWASKWRADYFVATPGQNTIMIDGKSQVGNDPMFEIPSELGNTPWRKITDKPLDNIWLSGGNFDFAESAYTDGYAIRGCAEIVKNHVDYEITRTDDPERKRELEAILMRYPDIPPDARVNVVHKRSILFAKPDYWIISDLLTGEGKHTIESMFHFLPTATYEINKTLNSVKTTNGNASLIIQPTSESNLAVDIISGQMNPIQGWAPKLPWAGHEPAPVAIYTVKDNLPVAIDTVLYPYPKEKSPNFSVERLKVKQESQELKQSSASGIAINSDTGVGMDFYLISHDKPAKRNFVRHGGSAGGMTGGMSDITFDGKVALVRNKDNKIWRIVMIQARNLAIDEKSLVNGEDTLEYLDVEYKDDTINVTYKPLDAEVSLFTQGAKRAVVNRKKFDIPSGKEYIKSK